MNDIFALNESYPEILMVQNNNRKTALDIAKEKEKDAMRYWAKSTLRTLKYKQLCNHCKEGEENESCPISGLLICDGVKLSNGPQRYERSAILKWLVDNPTNPSNRGPIEQDEIRKIYEGRNEKQNPDNNIVTTSTSSSSTSATTTKSKRKNDQPLPAVVTTRNLSTHENTNPPLGNTGEFLYVTSLSIIALAAIGYLWSQS
jgi:hypothetical protein